MSAVSYWLGVLIGAIWGICIYNAILPQTFKPWRPLSWRPRPWGLEGIDDWRVLTDWGHRENRASRGKEKDED